MRALQTSAHCFPVLGGLMNGRFRAQFLWQLLYKYSICQSDSKSEATHEDHANPLPYGPCHKSQVGFTVIPYFKTSRKHHLLPN